MRTNVGYINQMKTLILVNDICVFLGEICGGDKDQMVMIKSLFGNRLIEELDGSVESLALNFKFRVISKLKIENEK